MSPHKTPLARAIFVMSLILFSQGICLADFKKGDSLPDLNSFQLEGKLPDAIKGQVILLDFWASWCGPCKSSFPVMEDLSKKYGERGLTIIAVNVDEKPENMQRFVDSMKVTFPIVRDAKQKLVAAANIPTMPTSFLIDRSGKIRFIHPGFRSEETVPQYVKEIEQLLQESKP